MQNPKQHISHLDLKKYKKELYAMTKWDLSKVVKPGLKFNNQSMQSITSTG